jgi:hypothetical protein
MNTPLGLFDGASGMTVRLIVLAKSGEPFLFLPSAPHLAEQALALYPAQTKSARAAKTVIRWLLKCRVPLPRAALPVSKENPLTEFVTRIAGTSEFPSIGILSGNPRAEGRRFIVLAFGENGTPVAVVKVGTTAKACKLIAAEENFLTSFPAHIRGIPAIRASFKDEKTHALAMDFIGGESPAEADDEKIGELLGSWIHAGEIAQIDDLASWSRLVAAIGDNALIERLNLAHAKIHPVIFHGDFAPWNVKVSHGEWMALDWERGKLSGLPAWDWLHFAIQREILVGRKRATDVAETIEALLGSAPFHGYAERTRISHITRELTLAYLLNCEHVFQQTEGLETVRALRETLTQRWLPSIALTSDLGRN